MFSDSDKKSNTRTQLVVPLLLDIGLRRPTTIKTEPQQVPSRRPDDKGARNAGRFQSIVDTPSLLRATSSAVRSVFPISESLLQLALWPSTASFYACSSPPHRVHGKMFSRGMANRLVHMPLFIDTLPITDHVERMRVVLEPRSLGRRTLPRRND